MSLRTKSYDVTIQMKALCLFLHMALFVFQLGHLVEICFWLNLAVKGLNEVCLHRTYLFLKELVIVSDVFLLALLSHENFYFILNKHPRVFLFILTNNKLNTSKKWQKREKLQNKNETEPKTNSPQEQQQKKREKKTHTHQLRG